MARRVAVEIVGDSRSLEKAFARSSRSADKFNRNMSKSAAITRKFSAARAGAAAIAGGSIALGLRDIVEVAAESQQVLGQTSIAVENAGLSWKQYGDQIQKTIQAQSQFGFDDEALLRSFSLFVRGTGDVDEALRRNRLAMDISRGRFIDLEAAANLVNKAAMGQVGALRRAGIQVDKNATSTELLAKLQEKYGGAAEGASDDAATALERLQVQSENAKESLGTLALPVVTELATVLGDASVSAETLGDKLQRLGGIRLPEIGGGGRDLGGIFGESFKQAVRRQVPGIDAITMLRPLIDGAEKAGKEAGRTAGESFRTALREHLDQVNKDLRETPTRGPRGVTAEQRNTWWDAAIGRREDRVQDIRTLRGQLGELEQIADQIRDRIQATDDPTRRATLGDRLVGVLRQQRQVQEEIAQQARDAVQAEADRLAKIKAANQALKERADQIKSAILERLERRQQDVLNKRALRDAQERLRVARLLGGPRGTRLARENLQDVLFDIRRARIEAAPATLTAGGRFQLGNIITVNVHGVTDPNAVAIKVAEVLSKRARRTSQPTRGAAAGSTGGNR